MKGPLVLTLSTIIKRPVQFESAFFGQEIWTNSKHSYRFCGHLIQMKSGSVSSTGFASKNVGRRSPPPS